MRTSKPINILLVDDSEDNLLALNAVLSSPEYRLVNATSGEQALVLLQDTEFAVILLDLRMPGMDGLETTRRIRALEGSANTPIILVTGGFPDERQIRLCYEVGAVDIMTKPFDPRVIKCKVAVFAELFRKTEQVRTQERLLLMETELRRSRDELKVVLEGVSEGVIVYDRSLSCVYANQNAARLFGLAAAEDLIGLDAIQAIGGKNGRFVVYEADGQLASTDSAPTRLVILEGHRAPEGIFRFHHTATRTDRWIVISSRPVLSEAGVPVLAVTTYRDISEKRRAEENERFLSDATAVLASSLDYESTAMRIVDLAVGRIADWCKITLANEAGELRTVAVRHVNPELSPLADESASMYARASADRRGSLRVFQTGQSMAKSDISDEDLQRIATDDEHLERLRRIALGSIVVVPIRARDKILGTIGLGASRPGQFQDSVDIAFAEELGRRVGMAVENSMLYREAQGQRERLEKAVKARDEFISIASHELKTPMTSLALHTEMAALLLQEGGVEESLREKMGKQVSLCASQIDRISRLIEEMLDVSRVGAGKLRMEQEPLDLAKVARGAVDGFVCQSRVGGAPVSFEADGAIEVRGDPHRLEQVVTNLLSNAVKYGQGRPIRVELRCETGEALLSVRDQGIGIAAENHARIFERFERAVPASAVSGLGLGLYIVKTIVGAHGGRVWVESSLGAGATFTVALPSLS